VKGTAADDSIGTGQAEFEADAAEFVEDRAYRFDLTDQASWCGGGEGSGGVQRYSRLGNCTQKGEKRASGAAVEGCDGGGMCHAVACTGRVDRGSDGTGAAGLELARAVGRGWHRRLNEEEDVVAAGSLLDERVVRPTGRSSPVRVSPMPETLAIGSTRLAAFGQCGILCLARRMEYSECRSDQERKVQSATRGGRVLPSSPTKLDQGWSLQVEPATLRRMLE